MDKEAYEGLILAVVMAGQKKAEAGLKYAASGEYQDYPPGILELGVALDALNLFANDIINCVMTNMDDGWEEELSALDFAAAGFATIANNTTDEQIKRFALDNYKAIKGCV